MKPEVFNLIFSQPQSHHKENNMKITESMKWTREPAACTINADSIAFVNAGKKEEQEAEPKKAAKKGAKAKGTSQPPTDAPEPDEKDMPF